jgi:hypothetical protein
VITRNIPKTSLALVWGTLAFAAIGCSHELPATRTGQAAGEWTYHLPATKGPYAQLALGSGGSSEAAKTSDDDVANALASLDRSSAAASKPRAVQPAKSQLMAAAQPAQAQPAQAQPAPAAEGASLPSERVTTHEPTQALASLSPTATETQQRYAAREAKAQKLESYKGGDAIVISAGALIVILLIVVLILLLR